MFQRDEEELAKKAKAVAVKAAAPSAPRVAAPAAPAASGVPPPPPPPPAPVAKAEPEGLLSGDLAEGQILIHIPSSHRRGRQRVPIQGGTHSNHGISPRVHSLRPARVHRGGHQSQEGRGQ